MSMYTVVNVHDGHRYMDPQMCPPALLSTNTFALFVPSEYDNAD